MIPVALRASYTIPSPQSCSVLIPCFEVTNSETAGYRRANSISVNGAYMAGTNVMEMFCFEDDIFYANPKNEHAITNWMKSNTNRALFKYPSFQHPGEYRNKAPADTR